MSSGIVTRDQVVAEARRWFIYSLAHPASGAVRYVGWTRNPEKRLARHIQKARTMEVDYPVCRWIRKLLHGGLQPVMEILEDGRGEWESVEQKWIARLKSEGAALLNVALGGHFELPHASRLKAGLKLRGRKRTPEQIERQAALLRGRKRPGSLLEVNRRNAIARRGKQMLGLTEAGRAARRELGRRAISALHKARTTESADVSAARNAKIAATMRKVWAERKAAGKTLTLSEEGRAALIDNGKRNVHYALDAVRNMSPEARCAYRGKLSDATRRARARR